MGPRKSKQFRSNWWGKTYADNTNRVAIKSQSFPSGGRWDKWLPGLTAAQAVPSLLWGLNSLTLPGPTPVPSPRRPLQIKTQNHFKSPLAGPARQSHITDVLPVFPGFGDLSVPSLWPPALENPADFFLKSPSSSRGPS